MERGNAIKISIGKNWLHRMRIIAQEMIAWTNISELSQKEIPQAKVIYNWNHDLLFNLSINLVGDVHL